MFIFNRQPNKYASLAFTLTAILAWNGWASQSAHAELNLKQACQVIADTVCNYLSEKEESSVMIGNYYGSSGPEIQRMLKVMVEEKGFGTKDGMTLEGRCIAIADEDLKIRIVSKLLDRNFEPVTTIPISQNVSLIVDNKSDALKGTGTTIDLTKTLNESDPKQREENVKKVIAETYKTQNSKDEYQLTKVIADDYGVTPNPNSKYSVMLLVKDQYGNFQEKKPYLHRGKPFVDYNFGDVIGIKVINDSNLDVVVDVTIDGISVFEFSEIPAYKQNKIYRIRKRNELGSGTLFLRGWHKTNENAYEFLVSDINDKNSPVNRLDRPRNNIGIVNVLFYPAWSNPEDKPDYVSASRSAKQNANTVPGEVVKDQKKEVPLYFDKNTPLASISIRYDVKVDHKNAELPKN